MESVDVSARRTITYRCTLQKGAGGLLIQLLQQFY